MNISAKKDPLKGVSARRALANLEHYKERLLAVDSEKDGSSRNIHVRQVDSFIRRLKHSKENSLLDVQSASKAKFGSDGDFRSSMVKLSTVAGLSASFGLGVAGLAVGGLVGLASTGAGLLGLGASIWKSGFDNVQYESDHKNLAQNLDSYSEAILAPSQAKLKKDPLSEMSQEALIAAYDREIKSAPLSRQMELRRLRDKLSVLPEGSAAKLWQGNRGLRNAIDMAAIYADKQPGPESMADLGIHEAIATLESNREAQLSNLQGEAVLETEKTIKELRKSKEKTLFGAVKKMKRNRDLAFTAALGFMPSSLATVGAACLAAAVGLPLVSTALFAATAGVVYAGVKGIVRHGKIAKQVDKADQIEASIREPLKQNPTYTKISKDQILSHLQEKVENGGPEDQSFAKTASQMLKRIRGNTAVEMFENTLKFDFQTEAMMKEYREVLTSVLVDMPKPMKEQTSKSPSR